MKRWWSGIRTEYQLGRGSRNQVPTQLHCLVQELCTFMTGREQRAQRGEQTRAHIRFIGHG